MNTLFDSQEQLIRDKTKIWKGYLNGKDGVYVKQCQGTYEVKYNKNSSVTYTGRISAIDIFKHIIDDNPNSIDVLISDCLKPSMYGKAMYEILMCEESEEELTKQAEEFIK